MATWSKVNTHPGSGGRSITHIADKDSVYRADLRGNKVDPPYGYAHVEAICGKVIFSPVFVRYPYVNCLKCRREFLHIRTEEEKEKVKVA